MTDLTEFISTIEEDRDKIIRNILLDEEIEQYLKLRKAEIIIEHENTILEDKKR